MDNLEFGILVAAVILLILSLICIFIISIRKKCTNICSRNCCCSFEVEDEGHTLIIDDDISIASRLNTPPPTISSICSSPYTARDTDSLGGTGNGIEHISGHDDYSGRNGPQISPGLSSATNLHVGPLEVLSPNGMVNTTTKVIARSNQSCGNRTGTAKNVRLWHTNNVRSRPPLVFVSNNYKYEPSSHYYPKNSRPDFIFPNRNVFPISHDRRYFSFRDIPLDSQLPSPIHTTSQSIFPHCIPQRKEKKKNSNSQRRKKKKLQPLQHAPLDKAPVPVQVRTKNCLIIAVDATPFHIGGYCVNPFQDVVHYYSVSSSKMPWSLTLNSSSSEFEMKNLLCALLIWTEIMAKHKFVKIFTDNSAIKGNKSPYANWVHRFLKHLELCEKVVILNPSEIFLNSKYDKENFHNYITPADHLSRRREDEFTLHLTQGPLMTKRFQPTNFSKIQISVAKWTRQPCGTCGFCIERSGSLKNIFTNLV